MVEVVGVGYLEADASIGTELEQIFFEVGSGVVGDRHSGLKRRIDARVDVLKKHGFQKTKEKVMLNYRQVSLVSVEELQILYLRLGRPLSEIAFGQMGENILVKGANHFSTVSPGTVLLFKRGGQRLEVSLFVTGINDPCLWPGHNVFPDNPSLFVKEAMGIRGLTAMVFTEGDLQKGDTMQIVPWK